MSSGAKRLVQSLRGRTGGGGRTVGGGGGSTRSDGFIGDVNVVGSAGSSTSATRLCHYDSGHELDEISVVGSSAVVPVAAGGIPIGSLPTPTTPCHCTAHKYGSGQTLYSIAGLPPAPAAPSHRGIHSGGIGSTTGGAIDRLSCGSASALGYDVVDKYRDGGIGETPGGGRRGGAGGMGMGMGGMGMGMGMGMGGGRSVLGREREDDTKSAKSAESVSRGVLHSRQSLLDLVSHKIMGRHTPTHHYYHQQQVQQRFFGSSRDSLQGGYVNRGASELDLSRKPRRRDQQRSRIKLPYTVAATPSRDHSQLHTPASINHLSNVSCNGTETRYTAQQQQQQRGSRGFPSHAGTKGFRTGAPNWSFIFDPAGRLCYYWSMVVSLAFLYNFWVIIYSKNWVFNDSETADVVKQYLQSYYWCTLALTTIGDLPRPRSKGEYLFVIAQLLFGLLLFATVLGHVANIVTSVSAARKEFQG
ncbi:hypothetical protein M0804_004866 [Polistes exclamans]|nr:hypothetical protein M0804_004866 [Polistes exclamans]